MSLPESLLAAQGCGLQGLGAEGLASTGLLWAVAPRLALAFVSPRRRQRKTMTPPAVWGAECPVSRAAVHMSGVLRRLSLVPGDSRRVGQEASRPGAFRAHWACCGELWCLGWVLIHTWLFQGPSPGGVAVSVSSQLAGCAS